MSSFVIGSHDISRSDSLYALGVADQASKRLLEQHSLFIFDDNKRTKVTKVELSRKHEADDMALSFKPDKELASDVSLSKNFSDWCKNRYKSSSISGWTRSHRLSQERKAGHRLSQERKAVVMTLLSHSQSPMFGKRVRALWISGGGGKNIHWTCNVLVSFAYIVCAKASGSL